MGEITLKHVVLFILAVCALLVVYLLQYLLVAPLLSVLAPPLTLEETLKSQQDEVSIYSKEGYFFTPQFTPDGSHIVYIALVRPAGKTEGWEWDTWIMDRDGANQTRLTRKGSIQKVNVNPVLDRFAYTLYDNGSISVFIMSTDGTPAGRITGPLPHMYFSSWSPDGKRIAATGIDPSECYAFEILPDGNKIPALGNVAWSRLYIMDIGRTDQKYIGNASLDAFSLQAETSWSPDGTRIAFPYYDQGMTGIGIADLQSGRVTQLTRDGGAYPRWSPEGDWIAFIKGDTVKGGNVHVIRPDGSGEREISDDGSADALSWNPEGSRLAYSTRNMIGIIDPDGTNLTPFSNVRPGPVSWSPDGRTITFSPGSGARIRILTLSPELVKMEEYIHQKLERMLQI